MPRKNLKKEKIDVRDMVKSAKRLPAFDEIKKANGPKEIFFQLWKDNTGGISKRAIFFSVFAMLAVIYIILCISGTVKFNRELAAYILASNVTFGVAYHKKSNPSAGTGA